MNGIPNEELTGQQLAKLTCRECNQKFVAQWKWEKLTSGEKYFSLDCFFICPVCGTEHMYGLEQSANFSELVEAAKHTRRFIDSMTAWKQNGAYQASFGN